MSFSHLLGELKIAAFWLTVAAIVVEIPTQETFNLSTSCEKEISEIKKRKNMEMIR